MDRPLLISSLLEHAAEVFSSVEIVTRTVEGPIHRYTWRDARKRSAQVAQALQTMKLHDGDAVATIAWNTHRHLQLYYGVSGMVTLPKRSPKSCAPVTPVLLSWGCTRRRGSVPGWDRSRIDCSACRPLVLALPPKEVEVGIADGSRS
jgi:hypothetical protein